MLYELFLIFVTWYGIGFVSTLIGNALSNIKCGYRIDRYTAEELTDLIKFPFLGVITLLIVVWMAVDLIDYKLNSSNYEFYLFGKPRQEEDAE